MRSPASQGVLRLPSRAGVCWTGAFCMLRRLRLHGTTASQTGHLMTAFTYECRGVCHVPPLGTHRSAKGSPASVESSVSLLKHVCLLTAASNSDGRGGVRGSEAAAEGAAAGDCRLPACGAHGRVSSSRPPGHSGRPEAAPAACGWHLQRCAPHFAASAGSGSFRTKFA